MRSQEETPEEWFEQGDDLEVLSFSEVRLWDGKVIKKRLNVDLFDAKKIKEEYVHHKRAYECTPVATRPYPPYASGEYVYLAQNVAPGRTWETGDSLARLATAIASVHRCGLVHNDLSKENVFVTEGGSVTIIDWGEAYVPSDTPSFEQESRLIEGGDPILTGREDTTEFHDHYMRAAVEGE